MPERQNPKSIDNWKTINLEDIDEEDMRTDECLSESSENEDSEEDPLIENPTTSEDFDKTGEKELPILTFVPKRNTERRHEYKLPNFIADKYP